MKFISIINGSKAMQGRSKSIFFLKTTSIVVFPQQHTEKEESVLY